MKYIKRLNLLVFGVVFISIIKTACSSGSGDEIPGVIKDSETFSHELSFLKPLTPTENDKESQSPHTSVIDVKVDESVPIPDNYYDPITYEILTDPVITRRSPENVPVLNRSTLLRVLRESQKRNPPRMSAKHPYTQESYTMMDIERTHNLREEIRIFFLENAMVEEYEKAQSQERQERLTREYRRPEINLQYGIPVYGIPDDVIVDYEIPERLYRRLRRRGQITRLFFFLLIALNGIFLICYFCWYISSK